MGTKMGVWLDHYKAVIVDIDEQRLQAWTLLSRVDKQLFRTDDSPFTDPYEGLQDLADDCRRAALAGELNCYYYKIIFSMRNASGIYICGPGEAKGELLDRIERGPLSGRINGIETAEKMTERQIKARIAGYFQQVDQETMAWADFPAPSHEQTGAVAVR